MAEPISATIVGVSAGALTLYALATGAGVGTTLAGAWWAFRTFFDDSDNHTAPMVPADDGVVRTFGEMGDRVEPGERNSSPDGPIAFWPPDVIPHPHVPGSEPSGSGEPELA